MPKRCFGGDTCLQLHPRQLGQTIKEYLVKSIVIGIFFVWAALVSARATFEMPQASTQLSIDGTISDGEWENALWFTDFYHINPGDNATPTEETEAAMMYDDKNIYLMAKLYFHDKARHRDFRCSRDKIYTSDRIYFYLDTYMSNAQAYYLGCNANGEQADGLMKNDRTDPSIDLYYISCAQKTDYGFSLEIRLPLKSLNYQSGDDVQWGVFIKRLMPEGSEEMSSFPVDRNVGNFYENYGILQFSHLPQKRVLKVTPALVSLNTTIDDELADVNKTDNSLEPELNLFYEPSSDITFTATYNPDFNIVEADAAEVTVNNRFQSYYPEKRPFFIEARNPFSSAINIYHTRNIVNPLWGSKVSGNSGSLSYFGLVAQDQNIDDEDELELYSFAASKLRLDDQNSYLQMAYAHHDADDHTNRIASADANVRLNDCTTTDGQIAVSKNDLGENTDLQLAANAQVEYYNDKWYLTTEHTAIQSGFQADMGFITDTDIQHSELVIERHGHARDNQELIRYWEAAITHNRKWDYEFDFLKEHYTEYKLGINSRYDVNIWTGLEKSMIRWNGKNEKTWFHWTSFEYFPCRELGMNITGVYGSDFSIRAQEVNNEKFTKLESTLFIRPISEVDIELNVRYHELEHYYIARLYEAKMKVQFHRNFWFRLNAQVRDFDIADDTVYSINLYPLFAYQPNSAISLFVGASAQDDKGSSWEFDNGAQQIIHFDTTHTTWFFKISHTFDII